MTKKSNSRTPLFARCLALLALFTFAAADAAAQCASSPLFAAGQSVGVGEQALDMAAGDLNGDGRTDFVVAGSNSQTNISLIFGSAAGTLTAKKLDVGSTQYQVALGDFNNDGKLDLVTRHYTSVALRLGNGLGGFGAASTVDLGFGRYTALAPADFNNDGKLDLFIADGNYGASRLLLGDGGGGLGAPTLLSSFKGVDSVAAGDFNNDGKVDLAVDVAFDTPIYIYVGDGAGQFGTPRSIPAGGSGLVKAADLDKDGDLDLLATQGSTIYVRLGDGSAGFGAPGVFDPGFKVGAVAVGDVNGDGKADLVPAGPRSVGVMLGAGTGGFGPAAVYKLSGLPVAVAVGDFNGDGKADVATANKPAMQLANGTLPPTLSVLLGAGAGKLSHPAVLNGSQSTFGVAAGDLNGDGRTDLVIANGEGNVAVLRGNGAGGFGAPTFYPLYEWPTSVALGDLNGDGRLDILTTHYYGAVSVLVNTGTGFRPHVETGSFIFDPRQPGIGDFNNDGKADVAVLHGGGIEQVAVRLGDGTGRFGPVTDYELPAYGVSLAVNDFNGDGKADLAVGLVGGFALLRGNGLGGFGPASTFNTNNVIFSLAVADFNGDGKADVAGTSDQGTVSIFLGNGLGGFTRQPSLGLNPGLTFVTAADYDGDGKPDLTTAQTDGSASLYIGKGTGGFAPPVTFITGGASASQLSAADFNGDGRPDLAVANAFEHPPSQEAPAGATILFNRCSSPPASVPSLSVSDVEVTEGDGATVNATFTVNLSAAATRPVTVSFYPAAQNGTSGADFKAVSGRLTFAPGETTKTVTVPVIGDMLDEPDESFDLILSHPLNTQISKARGHAKIFDNDLPPAVSANSLSAPEGNSGSSSTVFAVSLSKPSGKTVTVKYATADGTATAPSDYAARALTTLTFLPGETTKDVIVAVRGDIYDEPNETFKLVLSSPTNATVATAAAGTCTITDDDPPPAITINNVTVTEPDAGTLAATFTVKLSIASRQTVTVKYATANGTTNPTAAGTDYTAVALTTLTFLPGEVTKTVTVQVRGDLLKEANETFFVNLSAATNSTITDAQGLGTILNDD